MRERIVGYRVTDGRSELIYADERLMALWEAIRIPGDPADLKQAVDSGTVRMEVDAFGRVRLLRD